MEPINKIKSTMSAYNKSHQACKEAGKHKP